MAAWQDFHEIMWHSLMLTHTHTHKPAHAWMTRLNINYSQRRINHVCRALIMLKVLSISCCILYLFSRDAATWSSSPPVDFRYTFSCSLYPSRHRFSSNWSMGGWWRVDGEACGVGWGELGFIDGQLLGVKGEFSEVNACKCKEKTDGELLQW